tara:strand:+ start:650 stop:799 length:150 start_codon:yes stop_codon:yes gene_type:complete
MLNAYSDIKVNNNSKIQGEKYPFYTHISPIETKEIFKNLYNWMEFNARR